jgi:hypothetical protein
MVSFMESAGDAVEREGLMGQIRGLTAGFVLLGLAVCVACSSDGGATKATTRSSGATTKTPPAAEVARAQSYLDSRYKPADVQHTFTSYFGLSGRFSGSATSDVGA